MPWDATHRRAAGFTIEILRHAWVLGSLSVLAEHPHLRPADVHMLLRHANEANAPAVGLQRLEFATVSKTLRELNVAGLAVRCDHNEGPGGHTIYEITRLGAGMLDSLRDVGEFGQQHWEHLVAATRAQRGLPHDWPVPPPFPGTLGVRAGIGMSIGLLGVRWAFAMLSFLVQRPWTPQDLQDRINEGVLRQPDLAGRRHLGTSQRQHVLNHLQDAGLVIRSLHQRVSGLRWVQYSSTPMGRDLMTALWTVAKWGVEWDRELWRIMAMRAGWLGT